MKKVLVGFLVVAVMLSGLVLVNSANADEEKPKYSISDVMKKAHKGGLLKKAKAGEASKEEMKMLVAMYEAMAQNKPPKGDAAAWKKRTTAIVASAKALAEGKKGAKARLTRATNCGSCHKAFKP